MKKCIYYLNTCKGNCKKKCCLYRSNALTSEQIDFVKNDIEKILKRKMNALELAKFKKLYID